MNDITTRFKQALAGFALAGVMLGSGAAVAFAADRQLVEQQWPDDHTAGYGLQFVRIRLVGDGSGHARARSASRR